MHVNRAGNGASYKRQWLNADWEDHCKCCLLLCARDSPVSKYFFQWRSYINIICFGVIVLHFFCTLWPFLVRLLMTFNLTIDSYMYCLLKLIAKGTPKRTLTKNFILLTEMWFELIFYYYTCLILLNYNIILC